MQHSQHIKKTAIAVKQKEPSCPASIDLDNLDFLFTMALCSERAVREIKGVKGPLGSLHIGALRFVFIGLGSINHGQTTPIIEISEEREAQLSTLEKSGYIVRSSSTGNSKDTFNISNKGENLLLTIIKQVDHDQKSYGNFIANLQYIYETAIENGLVPDNKSGRNETDPSVLVFLKEKLFHSNCKRRFNQLLQAEKPGYLPR